MIEEYYKGRLLKYAIYFAFGLLGVGLIYIYLNWPMESALFLLGIVVLALIIRFIDTDKNITKRNKHIITMAILFLFIGTMLVFAENTRKYIPLLAFPITAFLIFLLRKQE